MKLLPLMLVATLAGCASRDKLRPPWSIPKDDFGGATPLNMSEWSRLEDYPLSSISAGEKGYVTVAFLIGVDGRISDCSVVRSSGFARLDAIPCPTLIQRARFSPALDSSGKPRPTRGRTSIIYWTVN